MIWKKAAVLGMAAAAIMGISACGSSNGTQQASAPANSSAASQSVKNPAGDGKTIVVYFSATGNTRKAANVIARESKGDIWEIKPEKPYSKADLDYLDDNSRSVKEHNDPSIRPAISGNVPAWDSYSTVYLGYPIWWGEAPNIMYTFVESHDFSGKRVIPFCTSASSGVGDSAEHLHQAAGKGDWMGGTRFSGGFNEKDVIDWVKKY